MPKDYYKTLGVSRTASPDEIKAAFRKLAHQHHPDKKGGDASKFKELNEAYQALSDAEKRKQYDQFGTTFEHAQAQGGFGGFGQGPFGGFGGVEFDMGDLGDAFSDFFGGGRRTRTRAHKGEDIAVDLTLAFKDAAFGVSRTVRLYKHSACSVCSGSGVEPGSKLTSCRECGGKGQTVHAQRTVFGAFQTVRTCPVCQGSGQVPEKVCKHCAGAGVEKRESELEVTIPAGVEDGDTLRLSGQGEAGRRGGAGGDLYIRIHVQKDARFEREGDDVRSRVKIPLTTAVLGGPVEAETLDGAVELKIPEGTASGAEFLLRGKGIGGRRGGRGDQIVTVEVAIPRKLSREQKRLLEELRNSGL